MIQCVFGLHEVGSPKRRRGFTSPPSNASRVHPEEWNSLGDCSIDIEDVSSADDTTASTSARFRPRYAPCREAGDSEADAFTLIEVLLVIAILSILSAVVIIAINPQRQLATARDAQRLSDVYTILNAVHQYAVDNDGFFPPELSTTDLEMCRTGSMSCIDLYDMTTLTENQVYLVSVPLDPLCSHASNVCAEDGTGYFIQLVDGGRVRVSAPSTELQDEISVAR